MDYTKMKVVELKELLTTRNLPSTGKKDELVARLQAADSSTDANTTPTVAAHLAPPEDDFDFDDIEEDKDAPPAKTGAGAAPPVEKKEVVQDISNAGSAAAPAESTADIPAGSVTGETEQKKKFAFKRIADEFAPAATDEPATTSIATAAETKGGEISQPEAKPEETKPAFTAGLTSTSVEDELEKRKARAARFGVPVDESIKSLERGLRFATTKDDGPDPTNSSKVVKALDQALGEGRGRKRDHENANKSSGANNNSNTSRPGNDRKRSRGAPQGKQSTDATKRLVGKSILDDPAEKAKAEARAKKFGSS